MTNFQFTALEFLEAKGPSYPEDIAAILWPGRAWRHSPHGGPSGAAAAASWQLGKVQAKTKWVQWGRQKYERGRWGLTTAGQVALAGERERRAERGNEV